MGAYGREEILAAFRRYNEARDEASRTGDWSIWAAVFTEDARYVEHAYGEFHGRRAIEEWITKVMAPFPNMTFPQDWWALDEENDAIVFQCQNRLPPPTGREAGREAEPFEFPSWTRLVYGGGGLWRSEEDVYNPMRDAPRVFKAWRDAGGRFATGEQVAMKHR